MPDVLMKKGSKRMWRIAPKDNTGAIAVAEPKHRTVAVGISSGVSLRTFPKSTVQKVREICVHYVEKCSGKYENNKTAARYVYQMADEVINQLAGVAAQIRSAQRNEPDNMQELLDEWSIHFPPSLHSIGSPKAVALKLQRQTEELKEVRDELANEKSNHAREISEIMKSLDIQLHASCEGVMSERRQQLLTYEQQNADFEHQIRNAKVENDSIIGRLKMEYDATLNRVQDDFNNRLLEKSNLVAQVKRELKETKESNILEKSEADRIRRSENEDYSNQMIKLKSQLMAIQGVLPNSDSKDSFGLDSLQCDVESIVSLPCEEEKLQKKKQSMKFTGKVAKAVKQLKEKLSDSSRKCDENAKVINELSSRVQSTIHERDSYRSRLYDLESLNEALRKALSMRLYDTVDNSGTRGSRFVYPEDSLLKLRRKS